jgi:hypothetical protein
MPYSIAEDFSSLWARALSQEICTAGICYMLYVICYMYVICVYVCYMCVCMLYVHSARRSALLVLNPLLYTTYTY